MVKIKYIINIEGLDIKIKREEIINSFKALLSITNLNNYNSISMRVSYKSEATKHKNLYLNIMHLFIGGNVLNYEDLVKALDQRLAERKLTLEEVTLIHFHIIS